MLKEQQQMLQNMSLLQKSQATLLASAQNDQQQFYHLWAHRYLIKKRSQHKNVEKAISFLPGTFSNHLLNHEYLANCIQNKIEISSDDHPILQKLIDWSDQYSVLKTQSSLSLMGIIFRDKTQDSFDSIYSLITYINMVGPDITKLLRKKKKIDESQADRAENYNLSLIEPFDVLRFLNIAMPKVLYNIILPSNVLPGQKKKKQIPSFQCLYKSSSREFYLRSKSNYLTLIRTLIRMLLYIQLTPAQQKVLMEIVFNYFYAYHHDKKNNATDFFIQTYNKLTQITRFALSDQFLLFFRVAKKIGKAKFVTFLIDKSVWLKQIVNKITDTNLIGYPKDTLMPFNFNPVIAENIVINNGAKQSRYFQILQEFSLFYFKIVIKSLDITVRLYYLGDFNQKTSKILLFQNQKKSGQLVNNILAVKKGLYMFQFDNSYSWINKKNIQYQNIIFSPLQLKSSEPLKWLASFYENITTNQVAKEAITIIQKPQKKQQKKYQGSCNISKNGPFFNLRLTKGRKIYEFESQNEQKIVKKFNELILSQKNINWMVDSEPLQKDQAVLDKVKGYTSKKSGKSILESEPKEKEGQQISAKFSEDDEQVVERGVSQRRKING